MGQIPITAGVNIGAATYLTGLVTNALGIPADASVPILGAVNGWYFWLAVMVALMVPQVLINLKGLSLVSMLSDFTVTWPIAASRIVALGLTSSGKYIKARDLSVRPPTPPSPVNV